MSSRHQTPDSENLHKEPHEHVGPGGPYEDGAGPVWLHYDHRGDDEHIAAPRDYKIGGTTGPQKIGRPRFEFVEDDGPNISGHPGLLTFGDSRGVGMAHAMGHHRMKAFDAEFERYRNAKPTSPAKGPRK